METSTLIDQILLSANEDNNGLWEVYYEASAIFEGLPRIKLLRKARKAILDLVNLDWIQLYWCKAPLVNDLTPIDKDEVAKVLAVDKFWEVPEKDAIFVRFLSTSEGEKVFAKKFLNKK
jgi:hypothetical protein